MVKYIPPLFEPYKSKARAYLATSWQPIHSMSWTKVQFNTESYDVLGEFDSTTNYRFTAQEAGYYQVNAQVEWVNLTDAGEVNIEIRKNGTAYSRARFDVPTEPRKSQAVIDIIPLDKNDYLEVWVYQVGGTETALRNGAYRTFMSIHKLS